MSEDTLYRTLDPTDWDKAASLGKKMVDDMIDFIKTLDHNRVWTPMPEEVRRSFDEDLPTEYKNDEEVYADFQKRVMPYIMGNPHPKFWAWYMGSSTIMGAYADFLTSVTNSNAGAGNHAGHHVEDAVIRWLAQIVTYPKDASGLIVSGGSMANLVGLAVARHVKAGYDIRKEGVRGGDKQMTVYASTEIHSCNKKAMELMGLGSKHLRLIPVDENYKIRLDLLDQEIQKDKANGFHPICIIGSAGTVNTGAIDDLRGLADIARAENLWFHVDGAIGAIAMLSDKAKPLLSGIDQSDSIALDLHKWMHIPFEAGCILVKDRKKHHDTFYVSPAYLAITNRGLASGENWFSEYGIQLSRRLKALKIWMCMHHFGTKLLGDVITQNIDQAHYLCDQINSYDELEIMAPMELDIVCYRFHPTYVNESNLNDINKEILIQLHEKGYAVPSYTTLHGQYCIRVAIANHRSRLADFDFLLDKTLELGRDIALKIT